MSPVIHIVEADPATRGITDYHLWKHGFRTKIYESGADLLKQWPLEAGCILVDAGMPDMSGQELVKELRRRSVGLPVIFISGGTALPAGGEPVEDSPAGARSSQCA